MYDPKHLSRVRANEGLTTRRPKHRRKTRRSPLLLARAVSTAALSVGPVLGVAAYYDVSVESPPILLTSGDGEGDSNSETTDTTGGNTTGGAHTAARVSDGIRDVIDRVIDSVRPGSGANAGTGTNRPPVSIVGNGRSDEVENPALAHRWKAITQNAPDTTGAQVGESAQPGRFGVSNPTHNPVVAGVVAPVLDPPLGEQDPEDQRLDTGDPLIGLGGGVDQAVGNLVRPGLPGLLDFIAFGGSFVRDEVAVVTGAPPPGCSANPTCEKRLEVAQGLQDPALPVIDTIDQALIVLDWYGDAIGATAVRSLIENLSGVSLGNGLLGDTVDVLGLLLVDVDYFTGVPLGYTPVRSVIFDPLTVLQLGINASPVFLNLVGHQLGAEA